MNQSLKSQKIFIRIIFCFLILGAGATGMMALAHLKKPPAEVRPEEPAIRVEALRVSPENASVKITGYGEVQALDVVPISPEVSGKILQIHPKLEVGEVIPEGELLFEINPINYQAAYDEAKSSVEKWRQSIRILETKFASDKERLKTLNRNANLYRLEFNRLKELFEKDSVGALSNVDAAERAYNLAVDQADQMAQAVELYPIQITEAKSSLRSALAKLSVAEANLKRCRVHAPFQGRVKQVSVELGQFVGPGSPIVTLADDSILEIHVPIDSRAARQWLKFDKNQSMGVSSWLAGLAKVESEIRWTEDNSGSKWIGTLDRVVKFDANSRMLHLAIRVDDSRAVSNGGDSLPLVEGMFCSVSIPGKKLENVFILPRWAVSFENTVYLSENNRLKTSPVTVARIQGETAIVTSGIEPGDLVITTRLVNPLENSLLTVKELGQTEERS